MVARTACNGPCLVQDRHRTRTWPLHMAARLSAAATYTDCRGSGRTPRVRNITAEITGWREIFVGSAAAGRRRASVRPRSPPRAQAPRGAVPDGAAVAALPPTAALERSPAGVHIRFVRAPCRPRPRRRQPPSNAGPRAMRMAPRASVGSTGRPPCVMITASRAAMRRAAARVGSMRARQPSGRSARAASDGQIVPARSLSRAWMASSRRRSSGRTRRRRQRSLQ